MRFVKPAGARPSGARRRLWAVIMAGERVLRLGQLTRRVAGRARPELLRDAGEAALRLLELLEILFRHPLGRELGRQTFELGANEESLVQLLARQRADADAPVRDEVDEPERGEPAQRLADRGAADLELLRQLLLAEHGAGLELPGHDRFLDHEGDVVGLRRFSTHDS